MKNFTQSLLDLWKELGLNQRVSLFVAAVAVLGGLIGVVLWSQRPDYQLLYARMGEKDAAAVISHLQTQNIPHQVTGGGSAVQVPSDPGRAQLSHAPSQAVSQQTLSMQEPDAHSLGAAQTLPMG